MLKVVVMPKIGVNMVDAVVEKWLVAQGDSVREGQMILSAETDKATQDIPSTASGVVARLLVAQGDTVACQGPVMVLCEAGESFTQADVDALLGVAPAPAAAPAPAPVPEKKAAPAQVSAPAPAQDRVRISPLAAKEAARLGIDPKLVPPAKPGARITVEDVTRYAQQQSAAPAQIPQSEAGKPLSGARKIIAQRMLESVTTKPAVALTVEIDAQGMLDWRAYTRSRGREVRFNEMLIKIAATALGEFPEMNASMRGDMLVQNTAVNIGIAVDSERGLVVPKIFDADKKDIYAIQDEMNLRIANVRERRATLEEMEGGTFTISNLGMFGIEHFDAIINPPECAILAVGAIVEKPVVKNGAIVVGHTMQMTLSFDHRMVDGAPAAKFLKRVRELAQCPVGLYC